MLLNYRSFLFLILVVSGCASGIDNSSDWDQDAPSDLSESECAKLSALPNAPISEATCRGMVRMGASFKEGGVSPLGRRKEDEEMNCEEIFAELGTIDNAGVSEGTADEVGEKLDEYLALRERHQSEMTALSSAAAGAGLAAALADAAAVTASGGLAPSLAGEAASAAMNSQVQAIAERQAAEEKPVKAQMEETTVSATEEFSASLRKNPRFARLLNLAMQRGCSLPKDVINE